MLDERRYRITVTTSASRPRFYFGEGNDFDEDDAVSLNGLSGDFVGEDSRSFTGEDVPFRLRIQEPRGTGWKLVIQENGEEVYKKDGKTDRANWVLRDSFKRKATGGRVIVDRGSRQ